MNKLGWSYFEENKEKKSKKLNKIKAVDYIFEQFARWSCV